MNNINIVLKMGCIFIWNIFVSSVIVLILLNNFSIQNRTKIFIIFLLLPFIEFTRRAIVSTFGKPTESTVTIHNKKL